MPTAREHRLRAEQNLRFAQSFDLSITPFIDWVVVAYFYAALHLVDALIYDRENYTPARHKVRRELVKTKPYLRAVRDEYRNLKDLSEDARYRLITFTSARIQRDVIPLHKAIEGHILPQLR